MRCVRHLLPVHWHTLQSFDVGGAGAGGGGSGGDGDDEAAAELLSRFQVTTDRVLGPAGASAAALTLRRYAHFSAGAFAGAIDYGADGSAGPDSRGGFAAFRTRADERVRDLSAFSALGMRGKTDGR